jgi:hypothetical protein
LVQATGIAARLANFANKGIKSKIKMQKYKLKCKNSARGPIFNF